MYMHNSYTHRVAPFSIRISCHSLTIPFTSPSTRYLFRAYVYNVYAHFVNERAGKGIVKECEPFIGYLVCSSSNCLRSGQIVDSLQQ